MRQDNKIQVRLVSVSEVKFMLNLDEALLAKSEPNGPNIGFAHAISVNKEESMITLIFGVQYAVEKTPLLECRYAFTFNVNPIDAVVKIEKDKIEAIIILPRDLFITTDISVTLWILNQNKRGGEYHGRRLRNRSGEILFMDLRTWRENAVKGENKKKVRLDAKQIKRAADIYHRWQEEGADGLNYAFPELYRSVYRTEIEKNDFSLIPSNYIEFIDHDLEIDYPKEMARIQQEMKELLARERKSQEKLAAAFEGIGYGIE